MSAYGHFDDENHEYVITRPDTPQPWTNYSGDRRYGAIFSHHATGYSFTRSPATGRLLRYSHTVSPGSQPGRYFYLRDTEDGDFWSASWLPVAKPLDTYSTSCRMGMGTMDIESAYRSIRTRARYFIPLGQEFEYWMLTVTNDGDTPRSLDVFSYAEFTSVWDLFHDEFNQQYANAIVACRMEDGMLAGGNMVNLPQLDFFGERHQSRWWYMSQTGDVSPHAHDFERAAFLGPEGRYANPLAVARGACSGSETYGDTACGAFQSRLELAPGESKTLVVLLGVGRAETVGRGVRAQFGSVERAEAEWETLRSHWRQTLGGIRVNTPDPAFNSMVNVWGAYNALMTFEWSRSCSLVYTGQDRDGYGFRDTVQDVLGVLPAIPEKAKERLLLMLSGQESLGGAQPVVDPVFFEAGNMGRVDPDEQRADDCLWFFNAVPAYVAETGDMDFYDQVVPYADEGEDTVYAHLRRALEFTLGHRGTHGLACGLKADWNDCIILGRKGESVFVTLQLRLGLRVFSEVAARLKRRADVNWANTRLEEIDRALQEHAWDGEWFTRAITERGDLLGSSLCGEGQIFLNPQSWAVLSGAATPEQAVKAMDQVEQQLSDPYGLRLHHPSFRKTPRSTVHAVTYLPGTKENGAIFQHTQGWAVMADCMLGNGERAWRHFRAYLPSAQNDRADIREVEPYVYAQWTHSGVDSSKPGRSRVPWLSGTAAWSYFAATQYILGLRPEAGGLRIDPCISSEWTSFTMERTFRGKRIRIVVENPDGCQHGVRALKLETGEVIEDSLLPLDRMVDGMTVVVTMGAAGAPDLVSAGNSELLQYT
ncbi:MAG: N,N'-diacetylchitobiose phosphorylase [Verrucomicrobia bacterium]|nr:N,N'-diacetylchitobiose phosphorylase [Verrucomicrobiota bacterium]MCH8528028.1 N,N'-diacetylchitobiose phosphorylase [Kiritimatiellia bacterium]